MFIIFGWLKEEVIVKSLIDTHRYHCNHSTNWYLCKETEWVTFFDIRTIPFINKYFIVCERCGDVFDLDRGLSKQINKLDSLSDRKRIDLHNALVQAMEKFQLRNKTERQIKYIKTMRSEESE